MGLSLQIASSGIPVASPVSSSDLSINLILRFSVRLPHVSTSNARSPRSRVSLPPNADEFASPDLDSVSRF